MGGVLRQMTSDGLKVIKYVSKKFNEAQQRYSTTKRECLGLVWCVQKLKEFVWGRPIEIETDHCPLCSFNKKKFNNSRIDRWQLELSEYNITKIVYKRGRCNCDADLLSRFPYEDADATEETSPLCARSLHSNIHTTTQSSLLNVLTRSKTKHIQNNLSTSINPPPQPPPSLPSSGMEDDHIGDHPPIDLSAERIRTEQLNDPILSRRIANTPSSINPSQEMIENGLLLKVIRHANGSISKLPWIPSSLIPDVMHAYHARPMSGHFGINRTFHRLRHRFFSPHMYARIKKYIRSCHLCARFNTSRQKKSGHLQQEVPPEGVFAVMQMDYWKAPIDSSIGNRYVLVVTDRLLKFVFARGSIIHGSRSG